MLSFLKPALWAPRQTLKDLRKAASSSDWSWGPWGPRQAIKGQKQVMRGFEGRKMGVKGSKISFKGSKIGFKGPR